MLPILLKEKHPTHAQRGTLQACARCPACWPTQKAMIDEMTEVTGRTRPDVHPGEALLVGERGGEGVLYWYRRVPEAEKSVHPPLTERAADSRTRVIELVAGIASPALEKLHSHLDTWSSFAATFVIQTGNDQRRPKTLEGESYGLSLFLSLVSHVIGVALPVDLAASAEVLHDGSLKGVGSIDQKVRVIAENALGVRRFLVAAGRSDQVDLDNESEARAAFVCHRRDDVKTISIRHVDEALALAFPEWSARRKSAARRAAPGTAPSSVCPPPPTEGVDTAGGPRHLLAESLAGGSSPAFDLGTVWGLDRGRLRGLVAGFRRAPVFETMIAVEAMLFEAGARAGVALPARWWFRMPFDRPSAEPGNEDAFRALLARLDGGPRGAWLIDEGWPTAVAMGLVVEVPFDKDAQWQRLEGSLRVWLRRLERLGRKHPIDVIVLVQARTRVAAHDAVERLRAGLAEELPSAPEAVRLRHAPAAEVSDDQPTPLAVLGVEDDAPAAGSGSGLRGLLGHALAAFGLEVASRSRAEAIAAAHPQVIELIRRLKIKVEPAPPGPPAAVLAQLGELEVGEGFDFQLLSFLDQTLPEHVTALLEGYGSGARPAGERDAIRFAVRSQVAVDAYVDGLLAAGRRLPPDLLRARRGGDVPGPALLQGLARRHLDPLAARQLATLATVLSHLPVDAEPRPVVSLPSDPDPALIWKLRAEPITGELLDALLRSTPLVRAAFGLVDATGWQALQADEHLHRRVLELRGGRPLELAPPPATSRGAGR